MKKMIDPPNNILPNDGEAFYFPEVFSLKESSEYLHKLEKSINWQHDQVTIFGKTHITKRQVAWYGASDLSYCYAGHDKKALPWLPDLLEIKKRVEQLTNETYNSCLLNKYENGNESMGWHRDNESMLKKSGAIASISFGAERDFQFRHQFSKEKITLNLQNGSVLLMTGVIQDHWAHQLPKRTRVKSMRINLTFRTIRE